MLQTLPCASQRRLLRGCAGRRALLQGAASRSSPLRTSPLHRLRPQLPAPLSNYRIRRRKYFYRIRHLPAPMLRERGWYHPQSTDGPFQTIVSRRAWMCFPFFAGIASPPPTPRQVPPAPRRRARWRPGETERAPDGSGHPLSALAGRSPARGGRAPRTPQLPERRPRRQQLSPLERRRAEHSAPPEPRRPQHRRPKHPSLPARPAFRRVRRPHRASPIPRTSRRPPRPPP